MCGLRRKHCGKTCFKGAGGKDVYSNSGRLHVRGRFVYPQLCFATNAIISTFAGTASMLSGITAGAKALGLKDYHVVGIAGDGGTADIGIQALSGAIDRRINYLCLLRQWSLHEHGNTEKRPYTLWARTTTTPAGENIPGTVTQKKNMFEIVAAHGIDYAATASIGYIQDFMNKIQRLQKWTGLLISMFCPLSHRVGIPSDSAVT